MRRSIGIIAVGASLLAGLIWGCGDKGNEPDPTPVKYNIYAGARRWFSEPAPGGHDDRIYIYDLDSLTLRDSIITDGFCWAGEASADGQWLYAHCWRGDERPETGFGAYRLNCFNMADGSIAWTHRQEWYDCTGIQPIPVRLLNNGKWLVHTCYLLDASTGTPIRTLDYLVENQMKLGFGPPAGREVAAVCIDTIPRPGIRSDSLVVAVNVETGTVRGGFFARLEEGQIPLHVSYARQHPDKRRVLVVGARYGDIDAWFAVGDLETGELLYYARLSTYYAEIEISPDGTRAVVCDRANSFFGYGYPSTFVFDLANYQQLARLYDELHYWPGQARFLPDGHRVALMSPPYLEGTGWVDILDLNTMTVESAEEPFDEPIPGAIAIGIKREL